MALDISIPEGMTSLRMTRQIKMKPSSILNIDLAHPKTNNLLKFSTTEKGAMATVNFSVPDDVKEAFNKAYKGQNKSAVIAELMREAVERAVRKQRHQQAIANILARRAETEPVSEEEIHAAREELRA